MEGRNESEVPRKGRRRIGATALLVLGAALALAIVSAGSGSSGSKQAKPGVISTGKGFGEVYAATGLPARALSALERAVKAQEERLGADHPAAAHTRVQIGRLHSEQGRQRTAARL